MRFVITRSVCGAEKVKSAQRDGRLQKNSMNCPHAASVLVGVRRQVSSYVNNWNGLAVTAVSLLLKPTGGEITFRVFFCDLEVDLRRRTWPIFPDNESAEKMNFLHQGFRKLSYCKHTDRQTNGFDWNYYVAFAAAKIIICTPAVLLAKQIGHCFWWICVCVCAKTEQLPITEIVLNINTYVNGRNG